MELRTLLGLEARLASKGMAHVSDMRRRTRAITDAAIAIGGRRNPPPLMVKDIFQKVSVIPQFGFLF